jgi:hypothetical protein
MSQATTVFVVTGLMGWVPVWAMSETELRLRAMEKKIEDLSSEKNEKVKVPYDSHGVKKQSKIKVGYGKKGFGLRTSDGSFSTNIQWRAQMRFANPGDGDPKSESDFNKYESNNFELRRVRMKIGGHGYKPWLKYYFEVDLQPSRSVTSSSTNSSSRLIDWRIAFQPWDEFGFEVGQRKIQYNRERVDSSGRQQYVERSIVNRIFTIDRQVGVTFRGRINKGKAADFRYYAGVYNGEGRSTNNPDRYMMWMGRLQWNVFGRDMKWRQSDVKYHNKPVASLSASYATHRGVCTRWTSSGCGSLSGFSTSNQHKVDQWAQGAAFKYRGFSFQQEYHQKDVEVNGSGVTRDLDGLYAQVGYFVHDLIPAIPEDLELAFRYAYVNEPDSNDLSLTSERDEYTVGLNYFIAGHNNKVTLDSSILELKDGSTGANLDDFRVRLQWDISF